MCRALLVELRTLLDKIWSWGAHLAGRLAERRKDSVRCRAGQASNESTIFEAMDDWAAQGAMEALRKARWAESLLRDCAEEGGQAVEGEARVLGAPLSSIVTAAVL